MVASSATCFAPFSQNSACERSSSGSGQAQPGHRIRFSGSASAAAHSTHHPISLRCSSRCYDGGDSPGYFAGRFNLNESRLLGGSALGWVVVVLDLPSQNANYLIGLIVFLRERLQTLSTLTQRSQKFAQGSQEKSFAFLCGFLSPLRLILLVSL